jgi:flagellar biosynthesis activator protein FlaF
MSSSSVHYASRAYAKVAKEVADPRELEAMLLLNAAAKFQAVLDRWGNKASRRDGPNGLAEALLYNRRLWLIFIDAVMSERNQLPVGIRQNILNLSVFVMGETYSLMTTPQRHHLANLIKINRALASGLSARPKSNPRQTAA